MYAKAPYTVIQRALHIHPTVSELISTMLGELEALSGGNGAPQSSIGSHAEWPITAISLPLQVAAGAVAGVSVDRGVVDHPPIKAHSHVWQTDTARPLHGNVASFREFKQAGKPGIPRNR
jgi:hypothetical protein